MSTLDNPDPALWVYYSACAKQLELIPVDDYSHACDERLWAILTAADRKELFTKEARYRFDRMPKNRAKKYRRLQKQLIRKAQVAFDENQSQLEPLETLSKVQKHLQAWEWDVEQKLAHGTPYAVLAIEMQTTEVALKMRVSRWRKELRARFPDFVNAF